ncbi:glycosyltransferase family 4 protein [Egicoccus sp. AB-alg2]|uniref:glycosyltransferase family 4 protein n=1 Tax=Egicoccus sp. AB-alg2 TaxID=3242693 RepID=UPI00359ECA36
MVVHAYYPLGETRVQREAEALLADGWDVDVLCLRAPGERQRETVDGVRVRRLPVRRHRGQGMGVQLLEYLAFAAVALVQVSLRQVWRHYDAVQVHNPPDLLVWCALVPKVLGVPVVLDVHDLTPELFASRATGRRARLLERLVGWQERLACRFADHVITVTRRWRRRLVARGVPPEDVTVTMNVADPRHFRRDDAAPVSTPASASADGAFHVVYHGTLTERYGVDVLLDAAARLRDDLPGLRVSILGDGDARPQLLAQADRLGLGGTVTFSAGMLPVQDVVAILRTADLGVVPNRRNRFTDEILPTKLLEYASLGIPVVASWTPALEADLDPGMVAFCTADDADELASRIRALHDDGPHRTALSQAAGDFARRHDWRAVGAAYTELIDALSRRRRTTAPHSEGEVVR